MYSKIVLCLKEKADEILEKQIKMLSERHHAQVLQLEKAEADEYIKAGASDILFISDDEIVLSKAREAGLTTNNPEIMRKSYMKAMEMLKNYVGNTEI